MNLKMCRRSDVDLQSKLIKTNNLQLYSTEFRMYFCCYKNKDSDTKFC